MYWTVPSDKSYLWGIQVGTNLLKFPVLKLVFNFLLGKISRDCPFKNYFLDTLMEFPFNNVQNLEAARKAVISNSVKKSNIELIIPIILGEYTISVGHEYRYPR
jgi:hypothetical protein